MDPHAVLRIDPGASEEEVAKAYRELAKRYHPDRAGADGEHKMAELNAAYDLLRSGLLEQQHRRVVEKAPRPPVQAGDWLTSDVRARLGGELVGALEHGEYVLIAVDAATRDSHDVRLVVTDRRLLWLRDDAISDRVRYERYRSIAGIEARPPQRLRRSGELRLRLASGRRLSFGELHPAALDSLVRLLAPKVRLSTAS